MKHVHPEGVQGDEEEDWQEGQLQYGLEGGEQAQGGDEAYVTGFVW